MPKIFANTLADNHDQVRLSLVLALETCMGRKAYDQITMADIAAEAGIARNTIYNYARDKAALTADAAELASRPLLDEVHAIVADGGPAADRLGLIVKASLNWVGGSQYRAIIRHAMLGATLLDPSTAPTLLQDLGKQFNKIAAEGIREGMFRADQEITLLLIPGIMQAAAAMVFNRPDDRVRISDEAVRLITTALKV